MPDSLEIPASAFTTKTSTLITITVPQDAMPGLVKLRAPQGNIITKTRLGFSEPIILTSFSPASTNADSVITISGDYLNLIHQVIFTDRVAVNDTFFISHTRTQIQVKVPAAAQSGKIAVSNGAADPIVVYSKDSLNVKLPVYNSISPNPVKAGSLLTITGTDLNLIKKVIFGGNRTILDTAFKSKSATQIIVSVPKNAQDGKLKLVAASGIIIQGADSLVMIVPTIGSVTPNPVKPGANITVTGTNLDMITSVTFGGSKSGTIVAGGSAIQISVTVPVDATSETVKFNTDANKSVNSSASLTMLKPVITTIAPLSVKTTDTITITGINLDLVASINFSGNTTSTPITGGTASQIKVKVPLLTASGTITLVAKNGDQVVSTDQLTIIVTNVPVITTVPSLAKPGNMISITGTKLDLFTDVIFPGNVKATMFGLKTATELQVFVPASVTTGTGKIHFITKDGASTDSPDIAFLNVDPVADPSLVFFDFDAGDASIGWNDLGAVENDPSLSLSGKYYHVNAAVDGSWKVYFARNWGKFSTTGVDVSTYSVKMDINILEPVGSAVVLKFRLKGSDDDFWYVWKIGEQFSAATPGWITVSLPLSGFKNDNGNGSVGITDMSKQGSEYDLTAGWGAGNINMCVDNVRFQLTN